VTPAQELRALAGLATPMALRVAATFGLVDRAGQGGATAERLAAETGTQVPILRRLLDHLVTVGAFALDGDAYRPTELGNQMRATHRTGSSSSSTSRAREAEPSSLSSTSSRRSPPANRPTRAGTVAGSGPTWTPHPRCAARSTPR
jgi:hypothetical protein